MRKSALTYPASAIRRRYSLKKSRSCSRKHRHDTSLLSLEVMMLHRFKNRNKTITHPGESKLHTNTMNSMPGDLIPTNNIPAQPINTQAATQDIPKTVLEAFLSHYLQLTTSDNFDRTLWSRLQIHSPQVSGDAVRTKYSISFPETCANHVSTVAANGSLVPRLPTLTLHPAPHCSRWHDNYPIRRPD